jgi:hypothetical protein
MAQHRPQGLGPKTGLFCPRRFPGFHTVIAVGLLTNQLIQRETTIPDWRNEGPPLGELHPRHPFAACAAHSPCGKQGFQPGKEFNFLLRDYPAEFGTCVALGLACRIAYFSIRRRLR